MQELLTCVRIIVHNCRTQHSTKQFWLSSF